MSKQDRQYPESRAGGASVTLQPASLPRRLGAALYDAMVLLALWFLATALVLPLNGGRAIPPGNPWFCAYLGGWALAYFCGSWIRGGQTLGMRAWGIRVTNAHGAGARPGQLLLRFAVALFSWLALGMGYWWALARRDRRCWHDLASGTWLVRAT